MLQEPRRAARIFEEIGAWEDAVGTLGRKNLHADVCRTIKKYQSLTGDDNPSDHPIYTLNTSAKRWAGARARALRELQIQRADAEDVHNTIEQLDEALLYIEEGDRVKIYKSHGLISEASDWLISRDRPVEAIELLLDCSLSEEALLLAESIPETPILLRCSCKFATILANLKQQLVEMRRENVKDHFLEPTVLAAEPEHVPSRKGRKKKGRSAAITTTTAEATPLTYLNDIVRSVSLLGQHRYESFNTINDDIIAGLRMLDDAPRSTHAEFMRFYLELIQTLFLGEMHLVRLFHDLDRRRSSMKTYPFAVQQVGQHLTVVYHSVAYS